MILTLRIQLREINNPPVWRRIIIPASFTFHQLHETIQAAFGWWNSHIYLFEKIRYKSGWLVKVPDDWDYEYGCDISDSEITLVSAFVRKRRLKDFVYVYDLGDNWIHDITVEAIDEKYSAKHPICLEGMGAPPPEDCGGISGYENMKRLFAEDPEGEETQEYRQWLGLKAGEVFDPNRFDLDAINGRLERIGAGASHKESKENKETKDVKAATKQIKRVSLIDTMSDLKKGHIEQFAEDFNLKISPRLSKEKMKLAYAKAILSNPQKVLIRLPMEDLCYIKKLKDGEAGPNVVVSYNDYRESLLVYYGLADVVKVDESLSYLRFGDDFRDAVLPLISDVMDSDPVRFRVAIESYVEGMANLYGQVSRRQVKETLVRLHQARDMYAAEEALSMVHLMSVLFTWIGYETADESIENPSDDSFFYVSRYGWNNPDDLERERKKSSPGNGKYREFSEEEILNAVNYPMPIITNPKQKEFERMLFDDFRMSTWEVMVTCHDLWFFATHEGEDDGDGTTATQYFLDFVLHTHDVSPEVENKALALLFEYLDNMPDWRLRGFTAKDAMNPLLAGQRAAVSAHSDDHSEIFPLTGGPKPPFLAPKKVGRNDPCPCGSGKKYKHCCGKN